MPCRTLVWKAACVFSSLVSPGAYIRPHTLHVLTLNVACEHILIVKILPIFLGIAVLIVGMRCPRTALGDAVMLHSVRKSTQKYPCLALTSSRIRDFSQ